MIAALGYATNISGGWSMSVRTTMREVPARAVRAIATSLLSPLFQTTRPTATRRPRATGNMLLLVGGVLVSCTASRSDEALVQQHSAVTQSPATTATFTPHREDDVGPPPGYVPSPTLAVPPPSAPLTVPIPDKVGITGGRAKPMPAPDTVGVRAPRALSQAALVGQHQAFLARWQALAPTLADLPAEEQQARRAALKQQMAASK